MIKLVIFDIWNTLTYNPTKLKEEILKVLPLSPDYVQSKLNKLNLGGISDEDFFNQLTDNKEIIDDLLIKWKKINKEVRIFEDVTDVLNELKKDKKLALLSNSTSNTLNILKEKNLFNFFDKIYLSCDYGITKPDIGFFKIIIKDFNLNPKECIMVGDKVKEDLVPAKKLGIITVLVDRKNDKERGISDFKVNDLRQILSIVNKES